MNLVDVVILGGGCAGLSLARELADAGFEGSVAIVEPRAEYRHDRTWCFWQTREHPLARLVSNRWSSWSISGVDSSVVMTGWHFSYQQIPSINFYRDAVATLERSPNIELMMDVQACAIYPGEDRVAIETSQGPIEARYVVDTRPRGRSEDHSMLWQVFSGGEIEVDRDLFDQSTAQIMENLTGDSQGLKFVYLLPLSTRRALIQTTRFLPERRETNSLHAEFRADLRAKVGLNYRIVRIEHGELPMGQSPHPTPECDRVVRAGQAAGALRTSSGYGFLRIQEWARRMAHSFVARARPTDVRYESQFDLAMDQTFLAALLRNPDQAPDWFLSMGRRLSGDDFARFMSGETNPSLWIKLLLALPKRPFLRALFENAIDQRQPIGPRHVS